MLRRLAIALCGVIAAGSVNGQSQSAADERAVRDVVRRYVDARDRRDASALAALFTDDADQFTTSGEWRRGRDAVVKGGLASSQRNPGSRSITVESVRFMTPDVAIADGGYSIGTGTTAPKMWTTILLMRTAGGWRIAAIRNARPVQQ